MGGFGGLKEAKRALNNAHAQKYVNQELDCLKITNFRTECARAKDIYTQSGSGPGNEANALAH